MHSITRNLALAAAVGAFLAGTAIETPISQGIAAKAADLGGNCCADLEERVAELEATTVRKGNRKVSATLYGQVHSGIIFSDIDGLPDREFFDSERSESRIGVTGGAKLKEGLSVGYKLELGLGQAVNEGGDITIREANLFITTSMGTFTIGQASTASDGVMETTLGNGNFVMALGSASPVDSFVRRNAGVALENPFDGGRKQIIKYQTADIAGFVLSGSWADDDSWDIAARYGVENGQIRFAASVAYRHDEVNSTFGITSGDRQFYGGSATIGHVPTGLYIAGAYGKSDGVQQGSFDLPMPLSGTVTAGLADTEVTTWGVRGGISHKFNSLGATDFFVQYQELEISALPGVDPTSWGVGVVQNIDGAAMTVGLGWQRIDADLGAGSQADVITGTARIKF